jgi:hypothetical protein
LLVATLAGQAWHEMPATLGSLNDLKWSQGPHPLEWKQVDPAFPSVARLRFEPGFADPNWCTASHIIHVESGALSLELVDGHLTLGPGEFIHLSKGTAHRAKNLGNVSAQLWIVSHLEQLAGEQLAGEQLAGEAERASP